MRELLILLVVFSVLSAFFWIGYMLGYRNGISRPDPLTAAFNGIGLAMQDIAGRMNEAIATLFRRPLFYTAWGYDPNQRRLNEHPAEWVERVGAARSGYSIRPGEEWRYWTLRDWWTPDDVPDEFGLYYPKQKDAWSE